MKKIISVLLVITLASGAYFYWRNLPRQNITEVFENKENPGANKTSLPLKVADGFEISVFASNLGNARDLIKDPNGNILVSITTEGKVLTLPDKSVVVDNLNRPHGLAFDKDSLYIAETNAVAVYGYDTKNKKATNRKKIIDLPSGGGHFTRSLLIKNNKLYVSIGSSCNICEENDKRRAAIWVSNLDGSDFKPYATGLRNSVFMTANPKTNDIWATDMGRDLLGDDLPPEEINIVKEGANYGWPYCWGEGIVDNQTNKNQSKFDCTKSTSPHITFQAHSAPLGLAFLNDKNLLVAYHGSWNRTVPTGYKVVKFILDKNGNKIAEEDFISGWLNQKGEVLGRPVDVLVDDKNIYISDDKAGVVYLVKPI